MFLFWYMVYLWVRAVVLPGFSRTARFLAMRATSHPLCHSFVFGT